MDTLNGAPETLTEAVRYFTDPDVCLAFVASVRWPNGIVCPRCGSREQSFIASRKIWRCKGKGACGKQFSSRADHFRGLAYPPRQVAPALWMVVTARTAFRATKWRGRSGSLRSRVVHESPYPARDPTGQLRPDDDGEVEADETFIGGAAAFMHKKQAKRAQKIKGRGPMGKAAVMGLLQRHGKAGHSEVRVSVVPNRSRGELGRVITRT